MRRAPVALSTFATSQFKRFFDCGRAGRCMLPLGFGRFMHLVVLCGYQEADNDTVKKTPDKSIFAVRISTRNSRTGQKLNKWVQRQQVNSAQRATSPTTCGMT